MEMHTIKYFIQSRIKNYMFPAALSFAAFVFSFIATAICNSNWNAAYAAISIIWCVIAIMLCVIGLIYWCERNL